MIAKAMRAVVLAGMGAALAAGGARADSWPTRPVTLIVPFAAGGGTDAFARPIAQQLDMQLGQRVIVENRAGAGGTAGAAAAARAEPDGYTFFVGATHHAIAPAIYPKLTYDIEKDFIPVALISRPPHAVVIHPKTPANTLAELIAYAKANPDKLTYSHAGVGTTHHLAGELFKLLTGTKIRPVPYRGAGPAMVDLVAGQVNMAFDGLGSSAPQVSGGTIKALAVTSPERVPAFPDVPTAEQAGVKNFEVATWYALFAVKGTPQPVVDRMIKEVRAALATDSIKQQWAKNGSDVPDVTGKEFGTLVSSEVKRWSKVVSEAGIKME
ncbi:Bug family tripartite tricarboxylate transporter substrate binding protein [Enterovirga rhinocerotis]|uniref:Tripartite-type tricarboxylate transporter receptor subunit TctC n=1 Tax=Enterovirga rhinocerotis TaxID=1339210 RepID=A0A4R7C854_9HYPH|nr:tripartite tricarboxylate transporter substrate binding protein [Enterovirga rhinocerotis]TDR93026.1 tripartite-type tricarboxylate transporter receptor subunit TctC [Enterovirga rhinocerotis]